MADTEIEWADKVWNPIAGCTILSPGCTNCYAMRQAARVERMGGAPHYAGLTRQTKAGPVWTGRVAVASDETLTAPLRWRKPRRIFVNSMSDLFHEAVPDAVIDRVFAVMALAQHHTFLVLTKRAERMRIYVSSFGDGSRPDRITNAASAIGWTVRHYRGSGGAVARPLANVWLGVSVEDQARADERIPHLLATPAAVRWISAEPLLRSLDLRQIRIPVEDGAGGAMHDALSGYSTDTPWGIVKGRLPDPFGRGRIDWVVAGGESGPKARPMHPDWARSLRDQCAAVGVPFFFKQWGAWAPGEAIGSRPKRTERGAWWWDDRWKTEDITVRQSEDMHVDDEPDVWLVGKARAGRNLDGVIHDAYPHRRA